jgi:hypothetical protein
VYAVPVVAVGSVKSVVYRIVAAASEQVSTIERILEKATTDAGAYLWRDSNEVTRAIRSVRFGGVKYEVRPTLQTIAVIVRCSG